MTVSLSRYLVVKSVNLFLYKATEMPELLSLNGTELIPICFLLVNILLNGLFPPSFYLDHFHYGQEQKPRFLTQFLDKRPAFLLAGGLKEISMTLQPKFV